MDQQVPPALFPSTLPSVRAVGYPPVRIPPCPHAHNMPCSLKALRVPSWHWNGSSFLSSCHSVPPVGYQPALATCPKLASRLLHGLSCIITTLPPYRPITNMHPQHALSWLYTLNACGLPTRAFNIAQLGLKMAPHAEHPDCSLRAL